MGKLLEEGRAVCKKTSLDPPNIERATNVSPASVDLSASSSMGALHSAAAFSSNDTDEDLETVVQRALQSDVFTSSVHDGKAERRMDAIRSNDAGV